MSILPKTTLGKWSVGLIGVFFLAGITLTVLAATGQQGGNNIFDNLALGIPGIIIVLSGTSAFITGLIIAIKYKERSFLVFLATVIGFTVLFVGLGEVLFPH